MFCCWRFVGREGEEREERERERERERKGGRGRKRKRKKVVEEDKSNNERRAERAFIFYQFIYLFVRFVLFVSVVA